MEFLNRSKIAVLLVTVLMSVSLVAEQPKATPKEAKTIERAKERLKVMEAHEQKAEQAAKDKEHQELMKRLREAKGKELEKAVEDFDKYIVGDRAFSASLRRHAETDHQNFFRAEVAPRAELQGQSGSKEATPMGNTTDAARKFGGSTTDALATVKDSETALSAAIKAEPVANPSEGTAAESLIKKQLDKVTNAKDKATHLTALELAMMEGPLTEKAVKEFYNPDGENAPAPTGKEADAVAAGQRALRAQSLLNLALPLVKSSAIPEGGPKAALQSILSQVSFLKGKAAKGELTTKEKEELDGLLTKAGREIAKIRQAAEKANKEGNEGQLKAFNEAKGKYNQARADMVTELYIALRADRIAELEAKGKDLKDDEAKELEKLKNERDRELAERDVLKKDKMQCDAACGQCPSLCGMNVCPASSVVRNARQAADKAAHSLAN